jgi:hypothetical protein
LIAGLISLANNASEYDDRGSQLELSPAMSGSYATTR